MSASSRNTLCREVEAFFRRHVVIRSRAYALVLLDSLPSLLSLPKPLLPPPAALLCYRPLRPRRCRCRCCFTLGQQYSNSRRVYQRTTTATAVEEPEGRHRPPPQAEVMHGEIVLKDTPGGTNVAVWKVVVIFW